MNILASADLQQSWHGLHAKCSIVISWQADITIIHFARREEFREETVPRVDPKGIYLRSSPAICENAQAKSPQVLLKPNVTGYRRHKLLDYAGFNSLAGIIT